LGNPHGNDQRVFHKRECWPRKNALRPESHCILDRCGRPDGDGEQTFYHSGL